MIAALLYVGSYLFGSVPYGVLVARRYGVDIRNVGSRNIGATNVLRTCGTAAGLTVFLLDVLKGFLPALAGLYVLGSKEQALLCGVFAIVGHSLSPFIGFKGGKGIATGVGALAGALPWTAAAGFGTFLVLWLLTGYVSLASLIAVLAVLATGILMQEPPVIVVSLALLVSLVYVRHIPNIKRLIRGEEPKTKLGTNRLKKREQE